MKVGGKDISVGAVLQWIALLSAFAGGLTWADSRYTLAGSFESYAKSAELRSIRTQMEVIDEKIYRAKKDSDDGRVQELQRRYDLLKIELQKIK